MSDPTDLSVNDFPADEPDPFTAGADALRVEGLGSANGSAATNGTAIVNGHGVVNGDGAVADAAPGAGDRVIDLREAGSTRVKVSKDANPFNALSKQERMRLIVRVLCEIVAYGEIDEEPTPSDQPDHPAVTN